MANSFLQHNSQLFSIHHFDRIEYAAGYGVRRNEKRCFSSARTNRKTYCAHSIYVRCCFSIYLFMENAVLLFFLSLFLSLSIFPHFTYMQYRECKLIEGPVIVICCCCRCCFCFFFLLSSLSADVVAVPIIILNLLDYCNSVDFNICNLWS